MSLKDEASVRLVAPALREVAGERATEVLPALQNLSLTTSGGSPSGPLKEAIEEFIAARQLDGHPLTVHYEDTESDEDSEEYEDTENDDDSENYEDSESEE